MKPNIIHIIFLTLCLSCLFSLGLTATTYEKVNDPVDSTFVIPPKERALQYISSYQLVGKEKYGDKKYDEAIKLYQKAIKIIEYYQLESTNKIIYKNIGKSYYKIQDYENTIKYINEFVKDNVEITPEDESYAMHRLSMAHRYLGDLESAFSYELINYQIVEQINDVKLIWKSNYQLGSILTFQEDFTGSLEYFVKTEKIANTLSDSSYLYSSYGAIGNSYHQLDSSDLSLAYNQRALEIAQKIDYEIGISYSLFNIANNYIELEDYNQALHHHYLSLDIRTKLKDKWGLASSYRMLGKLYTDIGNYPEAINFLEKGIDLGNEMSAKPMLVDMYKIGADLYSKIGDYKLANEYLHKHVVIKEDMNNSNSLRKLKSQKAAYEISKRDLEISSLKNQQAIQDLRMRTFSYILLAIFPFIILLVFSYTRIRNANALLESKTKLIEKQNIALEESNKELEQFAYVASHDMREPIRTISSFNNLLKRRYSNALGERGLEFVNFIGDASNRLDIMLTDLLDYSRVNARENNETRVNLTDSAFSAAKNLTMKLHEQDVKLNVSHLPYVNVNPIQMERLFQNLIANGVKYNDKQEKIIDISHEKTLKEYIIAVRDNGIGIDPEYKDKVFEIFRRLHGTSEYEGSGIGLATCKKIVERHNGKIWLDSKLQEGTTVYFSIPISRSEVA